MLGSARAPGKVILLGEHAVVYGRSALAAALDRHVQVRLTRDSGRHRGDRAASPTAAALRRALACAGTQLGVPVHDVSVAATSTLPIGAGLGSSAALSVALVRALAGAASRYLDEAGVCSAAYEIEKLFHGHPSGIDNTVATYGGVLAFRRAHSLRRLSLPQPLPLVIAVGRAARTTRRVVADLRLRWESDSAPYERLFDEVDRLVDCGEQALADGHLPAFGVLMTENHERLRRLGVSTEELDAMVALALSLGAEGAKLTGAGGGGAVICLCLEERERLVAAFTRCGWTAFAADIGTQRGSDCSPRDRRSPSERRFDTSRRERPLLGGSARPGEANMGAAIAAPLDGGTRRRWRQR